MANMGITLELSRAAVCWFWRKGQARGWGPEAPGSDLTRLHLGKAQSPQVPILPHLSIWESLCSLASSSPSQDILSGLSWDHCLALFWEAGSSDGRLGQGCIVLAAVQVCSIFGKCGVRWWWSRRRVRAVFCVI